METDINLSKQGRSRWFHNLRTQPQLVELVSSVDAFTPTIEELYDEEIRVKKNGDVVVFLRLQDGEVTNYIVTGTFEVKDGSLDVDDANLVDLKIEESTVHHPLAGHGIRWSFNSDGEITENKWIS